MFTHRTISTPRHQTRNLILLFFTIFLGLGSVLTRASGITIQNSLDNNRQVMKETKITSNGLDAGGTVIFNATSAGNGQIIARGTTDIVGDTSISGATSIK
jgi:hypothetical protein